MLQFLVPQLKLSEPKCPYIGILPILILQDQKQDQLAYLDISNLKWNKWMIEGEKLKRRGGVSLESGEAIVTIQVSDDRNKAPTLWNASSTISIYLHKQTFSQYTRYGQAC